MTAPRAPTKIKTKQISFFVGSFSAFLGKEKLPKTGKGGMRRIQFSGRRKSAPNFTRVRHGLQCEHSSRKLKSEKDVFFFEMHAGVKRISFESAGKSKKKVVVERTCLQTCRVL